MFRSAFKGRENENEILWSNAVLVLEFSRGGYSSLPEKDDSNSKAFEVFLVMESGVHNLPQCSSCIQALKFRRKIRSKILKRNVQRCARQLLCIP